MRNKDKKSVGLHLKVYFKNEFCRDFTAVEKFQFVCTDKWLNIIYLSGDRGELIPLDSVELITWEDSYD